MTDQSIRLPRFAQTPPAPCPYLRGQMERKVFTELVGEDAQSLNDALTQIGFRRSQNVSYKPSCEHCDACISVRVPVMGFAPSRSMRRISQRSADLRETGVPLDVSAEQFDLMRRYLAVRHADGGMAEMDLFEFAEMVEHSPVDSFVMEYRLAAPDGDGDGRLIAACLSDVLSNGLSMIYSFFDPAERRRSLGTHMILSHINLARRLGLGYIYLGYWIANCRKMDYKARFRPLEKLGPRGWIPF